MEWEYFERDMEGVPLGSQSKRVGEEVMSWSKKSMELSSQEKQLQQQQQLSR